MQGDRLLVVDDDAAVLSLLRRGLTYEGYVVQVAASGSEALALARSEPPDLVVLDVMMRDLDGVEVCRRLRAADATLPIIMLTARDTPDDEVVGLEAGADDYVKKPFQFEVLSARIRSLLRRRQPEPRALLRYHDLVVDLPGHSVTRGTRRIELTPTEYALLELLLRHQGQVLTKEHILDEIWGYDFGGSANIVEVYVRALRTKLEAGGEPRLIQTVRGTGYVLREAGGS